MYIYFRREGKSVEGESVLQAYSWQGRGASSKNNEGIVAAFFCTSNGKIESNGLVSVHVTFLMSVWIHRQTTLLTGGRRVCRAMQDGRATSFSTTPQPPPDTSNSNT